MRNFELFDKTYIENSPVTGVMYPRTINYLTGIYETNIKQIELYYKERNFSVKNTNLISRILELIPLNLSYSLYDYVRFLESRVDYVAKHFKLTSDLESGIVHIGEFFANDDEIIFSIDLGMRDSYVVKNWENVCAVKVYKHNRNDTKLLLPFGNLDDGRSGLSVYGIDLKVLILQYREYVKFHIRNNIPYSRNRFVVKYVISKTVGDIVDGVFINRVMDKYYNREIVTPKYKHTFKLYDRSDLLQSYADYTLKAITNNKKDYINILHDIKLVNSFNAAEYFIAPDMVGTSQSETFLIISKLDVMCFLIDVGKASNNQHFINDFKRLVKRLKNDNYIKNNFSYIVYKDIQEKIKKINEA